MSLLASKIRSALRHLEAEDVCACNDAETYSQMLAERMEAQERDAVPCVLDGSTDRTEQL